MDKIVNFKKASKEIKKKKMQDIYNFDKKQQKIETEEL